MSSKIAMPTVKINNCKNSNTHRHKIFIFISVQIPNIPHDDSMACATVLDYANIANIYLSHELQITNSIYLIIYTSDLIFELHNSHTYRVRT